VQEMFKLSWILVTHSYIVPVVLYSRSAL